MHALYHLCAVTAQIPCYTYEDNCGCSACMLLQVQRLPFGPLAATDFRPLAALSVALPDTGGVIDQFAQQLYNHVLQLSAKLESEAF